jgi:peroxiredoxin
MPYPRHSLSLTLTGAILIGTMLHMPVQAAPQVDRPAPDFSVADTAGKTWTLKDLAGRTAVLEWTNHDCPFVRKHYGAGNMQAQQKEATARGILWLSVISSAPGKQGHVSPAEADALTKARGAAPTAVLLDETGAMGRAYGAQTTPHLYVIGPDGTLRYMGGIDDRPTANPADIPVAKAYLRAALADLAASRPVAQPVTRPYGCSVKY